MSDSKPMNDLQPDLERMLTASRLRLRLKSPFFATLALFAEYIVDESVPTAGTDGRNILVNPDYIRTLSPAALDGLLVHEVLHAALRHTIRLGNRDGYLWNIAADVVVNGIIAQHGGFSLPEGAIRKLEWESHSVEEVYALLMRKMKRFTLPTPDLLYERAGSDGSGRNAELEAHWEHALKQAELVGAMGQGLDPAGLQRHFSVVTSGQLDWAALLWRFVVRTPTDFSGFDRRFIGQKMYLDVLEGEGLQVVIGLDTSGSILEQDIGRFLSEVQGVLGAYPHVQAVLYYMDAALYGPYELTAGASIPMPLGEGGTSFVPFFEAIQDGPQRHQHTVAIILTDGEGRFPDEKPETPTLWVITPGGRANTHFPFGETIRLIA